jgi:hypothetical protein
MNRPDSDRCPVCGVPVRIIRRASGAADHYEPILAGDIEGEFPTQDPIIAQELRELRKGKKTVVLLGGATTHCTLAPFDDDVEIWSCNEMHWCKWLTRATRWFQVHGTWNYNDLKRQKTNHIEWLKNTSMPVYMIRKEPSVPTSIAYPIKEVSKFFENIRRGNKRIRYFTSSFAYMMGIALLEGFERIELYGFDFADDTEYAQQKGCAEWWIGYAMGKGVEIYEPDNCQIMNSTMYGDADQGKGWTE